MATPRGSANKPTTPLDGATGLQPPKTIAIQGMPIIDCPGQVLQCTGRDSISADIEPEHVILAEVAPCWTLNQLEDLCELEWILIVVHYQVACHEDEHAVVCGARLAIALDDLVHYLLEW
eukprot:CAMPEP_0171061620 /NCGR_PEP_ID=MMETSP0766_2-20121228/4557_1 /TAXON_ID=439317 /ORGANISM="Gambierdiscus australes, Strain CAWD 149" /LENGTH=119 /DNA_ID=CAMNT_0011517329 /DNA_START=90 /DNA_END=450 /DNA_ORIENTATION=+